MQFVTPVGTHFEVAHGVAFGIRFYKLYIFQIFILETKPVSLTCQDGNNVGLTRSGSFESLGLGRAHESSRDELFQVHLKCHEFE